MGHQLFEEREIAQEAFPTICYPNSGKIPPNPIGTDAYASTMLRTALEKLDENDLPGVILKYAVPGMPVEPGQEAAQ